MGISLGQIITPLIIKNAEDIQMMNIIWFVPAAIGKEKSFCLHRNVQNGFELDFFKFLRLDFRSFVTF